MIWSWVGERELPTGPENSCCLGEILWREEVDYEIDGGVTDRPFGPQIGDGKCERPPPPCGLSRKG